MLTLRPRSRVLVRTAAVVGVLTLGLLVAATALRDRRDPAGQAAPAPAVAQADPAAPAAAAAAAPAPAPAPARAPLRMSVLTVRLERNQTLAQALARLELAPGQAQAILRALADKFPFRRSKPGDQLRIERRSDDGALHSFTYRQSAADEWTVRPAHDGGELRGEKRAVQLTTEVAQVDVTIRGSVWESLQRAGEDPGLAAAASDVLAWDVDFYQDVRTGDRLRLVVEKIVADGKLLRYGNVLAAGYDGEMAGHKRLFRYTDDTGFTTYYDEEGRPARKGFLKAPLPFARMTSSYGSRVHPVLGYVKAHQGVDYGAPTGTPVWAAGDGTVVTAGWQGGCGKAVTLRHRNGLDTVYCHLSAVSVHAGARVSQKQVIGLVGQTGLATGPHLHYAVRRGGAFVNPLSLKMPPEAPLPPKVRETFLQKIAPVRELLEKTPVV